MDIIGSEIGQKMRLAIKAKLTEMGTYVDDELPDYVMVMVANKRSRPQMEEDLQLFLGNNTGMFVIWLHTILAKLQEVTVSMPVSEPAKERKKSSSKDQKLKLKKEKHKKNIRKKSKKKEKSKHIKIKSHKHKKRSKSKDDVISRPNIPPLLMNIEKVSEPSITDVFAGQILKNHGVLLGNHDDNQMEKIMVKEIKPIINPDTISIECNESQNASSSQPSVPKTQINLSIPDTRQEQLKEINEIEDKMTGLRKKLASQLDSASDDEDFNNIRSGTGNLINDLAEDVVQEIDNTDESVRQKLKLNGDLNINTSANTNTATVEVQQNEDLSSQIELNLPKRPIRDRLGTQRMPAAAASETVDNVTAKSHQFEISSQFEKSMTPQKEMKKHGKDKHRKSESAHSKVSRRKSQENDDHHDHASRKHESRKRSKSPVRVGPSSVVQVRQRQRPTNSLTSNLLLRAMADAQKSIMNLPPKTDRNTTESQRGKSQSITNTFECKNIEVQIPCDAKSTSAEDTNKVNDKIDENEYVPTPIIRRISNTNYTPTLSRDQIDQSDLVTDIVNIHNAKRNLTSKERGPTFVVTLDGLDPNVFLAKKLKTEGLIQEEEELSKEIAKPSYRQAEASPIETDSSSASERKRLSDTSVESDTQVIIKSDNPDPVVKESPITPLALVSDDLARKRKGSPIVFDLNKREKPSSSDSSSEKEGDLPKVSSIPDVLPAVPMPTIERKPAAPSVATCRTFPMCRFGSACAFAHPQCKFGKSCTRRNCIYSHSQKETQTAPNTKIVTQIASQVVPAANYKTITQGSLPNMCKYYPNCTNPGCYYYHPKPCRFGKSCLNKLECNFYHVDSPATKWRSIV